MSLEALLAPMAVETFIGRYWSKAPYHLVAESRDRLHAHVCADDVEQHLLAGGHAPGDVVAVAAGGAPYRGATAGGALEEVLRAYEDGRTVVVNRLHQKLPKVARLCAAVERRLCAAAGANAYLTPPGLQGFARHFDTHDVLVIQLAGRKRWLIDAPPLRWPLDEQNHELGARTDAPPLLDTLLRPGDVLYLPAGFPHEAFAADGDGSMHLSIGLRPLRAVDIAIAALREAALADETLRAPLPPGAPFERLDAGLAEALAQASRAAFAAAGLERGARRAALGLLDRCQPHKPAPLATRTGLAALGPSTSLARAEDLYTLTEAGGMARLKWPGGDLLLPEACMPALAFVTERSRFTVADVPAPLGPEHRELLLKTLTRQGFLRPDEEADRRDS